LGVVLYELLAGRPPFSTPGPTPQVLEWRICEELPERPSAAATEEAAARMRLSSVQKLRRALEGEVDDIVMMALRKEPERRYASVEQLSEDLRRYLDQLPVIARSDTLGYRAAKFVRRNRALVGTGTVALVAVLLALVAIGVQARVAKRERDRARLEAAKAEQLNLYLQGMLRSPDPRVDGQNVTVAQVLDAATQRAESELASQPDLQSAAQTALGRTYVGLGLYDKAEAPLRSAVATRRRLGQRERMGLAESLDYLAVLLTARGDAQQAEPLITEALDIVRADASVEPLILARVLHDYGEMLNGKGDYAGAERYHREALDIRRSLLGDVHEDVATSLNNLAVQLGEQGRLGEAEPLHRQALDVMRRAKGPEHPDVAATLNTLAFVLSETRKYDAADSLYGQAIALRRKLLGADHPETAWTVYAQGAMLFDRGDYHRSLANAREVLRLRAKTLPDAHPLVATALQLEGRSVAALGDPTNALPSLRASLELRRRSLPAAHWLIASSESVLGECLMKAQRYAEAEAHLLRGYQDLVSASGAQHARSLDARRRLAALYDAWGKPGEAAKYR
jgi:serine/threonine-protein kinase